MIKNICGVTTVALTTMFTVICSISKTDAGCYCMMRNMSVLTGYSKSGFSGCTTNVIAEIYLQSTQVYTDTGSGNETTEDSFYSFQVSRKDTDVITYLVSDIPGKSTGGWTSEGCKEYALPRTETDNKLDNGNTASNGSFSQWNSSENIVVDTSGNATDSTSGTLAWDDGAGFMTAASTNVPPGFPYPGIGSLPQTFETNYCIDGFSEYKSVHSSSDEYGSQSETFDTQTTLSQPFTDELLRGCIISLMPAWPANWSGGSGNAFYNLSQDHSCGSGGQMKYQLLVPNSQVATSYTLEWQEVTTYPGSTNVTYTTLDECITGTGDPTNPAPGIIHFVAMPKSPSEIYETAPTIISSSSSGSSSASSNSSGGGSAAGTGGSGRRG